MVFYASIVYTYFISFTAYANYLFSIIDQLYCLKNEFWVELYYSKHTESKYSKHSYTKIIIINYNINKTSNLYEIEF